MPPFSVLVVLSLLLLSSVPATLGAYGDIASLERLVARDGMEALKANASFRCYQNTSPECAKTGKFTACITPNVTHCVKIETVFRDDTRYIRRECGDGRGIRNGSDWGKIKHDYCTTISYAEKHEPLYTTTCHCNTELCNGATDNSVEGSMALWAMLVGIRAALKAARPE